MAINIVPSICEISDMVKSGKTYAEISRTLQQKNPGSKGLSAISVRRFCKENCMNKNTCISDCNLDNIIRQSISEVTVLFLGHLQFK